MEMANEAFIIQSSLLKPERMGKQPFTDRRCLQIDIV